MDAIDLDPEYFVEQTVVDDATLKEIHDNQKTLQVEAKWFLEKEEYQKILSSIKDFRVLKMPQIIQALFFLNKVEREKICEPNSNKMSWKKAKQLLEQNLPENMATYKTFGEKKDDFRSYMRINYVETLIGSFV